MRHVALILAALASTPIIVRYVPYDQLQAICKGPASGCAYWREAHRTGKPCRIYLPIPWSHPSISPAYNAETLDHEIQHCRHGVTHPES